MGAKRRRPSPGEVLRAWPVLIVLVLLGMIVVGGPAMAVVGVKALADARDVPGGVRTTGEVIDSRSSSSYSRATGNDVTYVPRIRFETDDGETVRFWGNGDSDPVPIGSEVPVSYRPGDPRGAHQIGGNLHGWGYLIVGLVMTAVDVAIVVAFVRRRRRRRGARRVPAG